MGAGYRRQCSSVVSTLALLGTAVAAEPSADRLTDLSLEELEQPAHHVGLQTRRAPVGRARVDLRHHRRRHPPLRRHQPARSAAPGAQPAGGARHGQRLRDQRARLQQQRRQQAAGADRRPHGLHAAVLRRVLGRAGRDARGHRAHRGDQRARAARCGAPTRSTASSTSSPVRRRQTQGGSLSAGAGNREARRRRALRRHAAATTASYRVYAQAHRPRRTREPRPACDERRAGTRARSASAPTGRRDGDQFTRAGRCLQRRRRPAAAGHDLRHGLPLRSARSRCRAPTCSRAGNAASTAARASAVQAYYDRTERTVPPTFSEKLDIVDVQFQHSLAPVPACTR